MAANKNGSGPVILERYQLLRQLGEGGMGAVYQATHIHLGSTHAVKALRPAGALTPDQLEQLATRFLREAKICASVKHPNLVPVTDFGTTDGTPYIVMDFIDGRDLRQVIDDDGALGEERALRTLRDVAGALGALHDKGIIHRDMKPANVMIEKATGRVILTDLGIARDTASAANLTQGILGTPAFMPPEQVEDTASTGTEGDVYALGATFYAMLAGRDPFEGENAVMVIQNARESLFAYGSIAGVAENRDRVHFKPAVHKLLHDMTTYDRNERINSMKEVIKRVDAILGGGKNAPSDEVTFLLDEAAVSQAGARQGPAAGPMRPPTGAPPGATPPQYGPPRQTGPDGRPPTGPQAKSALAALSGGGGGAAPERKDGRGAVAVVVVLLFAGLGAAGYLAVDRKWVVIPGVNDGKSSTTAPTVATGTPEVGDAGAKPPVMQPAGTQPTGPVGPDQTKPAGDDESGTKAPATAVAEFLDPAAAPRLVGIPLAGAKPLELVLVPPGKFTIGTPNADNDWELPAREIEITRPFYIGRCEVTVGQYAAFLRAHPPRASATSGMNLATMGLVTEGEDWRPAEGAEDLPIRSVPHLMARKFCEWVSETAGVMADLPGEVEWEYVARGPESRTYPWGNDWEDGLACADGREGPAAVGSFPDGASWCGALDMAGNVFEWTADEFVGKRYADLAAKDPEALGPGSSSGFRVFRGGCYGNDEYVCRAANRMGLKGSVRKDEVGFRIKVLATSGILKHVQETPAPASP